MKNIRQDVDDSLRAEYTRSDLGEMIRGKHAAAHIEFAELVHLLLACIGEDEGLKFTHHQSENQSTDQKPGEWTYEIDESNQITLRYWSGEFESIDERIPSQCCITTPQDRSEFQNLLTNHVHILRTRAGV